MTVKHPVFTASLRPLLPLLGLLALVALPACGDKDLDFPIVEEEDGGSTGGLEALPDADYPVCEEDPDGISADCCTDVYCTAIRDNGLCPAAVQVDAGALTGVELEVEGCLCAPVDGPFAPPAGEDEPCCYLIGIMDCPETR